MRFTAALATVWLVLGSCICRRGSCAFEQLRWWCNVVFGTSRVCRTPMPCIEKCLGTLIQLHERQDVYGSEDADMIDGCVSARVSIALKLYRSTRQLCA